MPRPEFIMELAEPRSPLPEAVVYVFAEAGQGEREGAVETLFDDAGVEQALAVRRHKLFCGSFRPQREQGR